MAETKSKFTTVEAYIASFPEGVRAVLEKMRGTIARAAPRAEPVISYQMPAYKQGKVLLFFSAWKDHFSLFIPSATALQVFRTRLAKYEVHKATVKIPLAGPIPYALIAALTRHRVKEETAAGIKTKTARTTKAARKTKTGSKAKAARTTKAGRGPKRKAGA